MISYFPHTKHNFPVVELVLSPIKELLATIKYVCHCCTLGVLESCWLFWRFIYLLVGKDYWLLPSLEGVMVPSNTMKFCLQRRDIKISSCSGPLSVSEVRAVFNNKDLTFHLWETTKCNNNSLEWFRSLLNNHVQYLKRRLFMSSTISFVRWLLVLGGKMGGLSIQMRKFHLYLYTCLLQIF